MRQEDNLAPTTTRKSQLTCVGLNRLTYIRLSGLAHSRKSQKSGFFRLLIRLTPLFVAF